MACPLSQYGSAHCPISVCMLYAFMTKTPYNIINVHDKKIIPIRWQMILWAMERNANRKGYWSEILLWKTTQSLGRCEFIKQTNAEGTVICIWKVQCNNAGQRMIEKAKHPTRKQQYKPPKQRQQHASTPPLRPSTPTSIITRKKKKEVFSWLCKKKQVVSICKYKIDKCGVGRSFPLRWWTVWLSKVSCHLTINLVKSSIEFYTVRICCGKAILWANKENEMQKTTEYDISKCKGETNWKIIQIKEHHDEPALLQPSFFSRLAVNQQPT